MSAELFEAVFNAFAAQSGWEWLAAALGIVYVILAAKESVWYWPSAFVSTLIYTVLFWEGQLPMQSLLNFYYLIMAVYGYSVWQKQGVKEDALAIHKKPLQFHMNFIAAGLTLSLFIGMYLDTFESNRLPYLDALVTVFSVMATVLMARKVLENWIYWIVIDSFAIVLYWQTGFYVTIIMFVTFLVLAVYGYKNWLKLYQQKSQTI